ncbi:MAG: sigma-70 family RNA polymerase sigma factor [Bacteroidales bacterium]|jgi:RNA polymerase sigma-70 factor (ECF subfamily)
MDEIYIQRILEGDHQAFRQLIAKYKDMAYSIAMSVVKDEFYAEEVIQLSFLIAFNKLSSFKGIAKFSTWFYRIVINESFKILKKNKTEFIDFVDTIPDISNDKSQEIFNLELDDQKYYINEALKRMSPKESLALRLFYLDQNSLEEICSITGWTLSSIKVILFRARTDLKYILTNIFKLDKKVLY